MVSYLKEESYVCEQVYGFSSALDKIEIFDYDCILLDITLPDGNGLKLLEILKADRKYDGVIIISAKDSPDDKIAGLNLGADDYMTKPFHLPELKARIDAVVRRKIFGGNNLLVLGDIRIDLQAKTTEVNNRSVNLTPKEYNLLIFFIANKNKVISRNALSVHISGDDADWTDNYSIIYTHIKNLKKKLAEAGGGDRIQSVYGMGYRFETE